mgnify:CR=1 FL=1
MKYWRSAVIALPFLFSLYLWRGHEWQTLVPLFVYTLMSLVCFLFYGLDKRSAKKGTWRTPEFNLHVIEALGGWPGALLAQLCFRHKTQKKSFKAWLYAIIVLHFLVFAFVLYKTLEKT